MATDSAPRRFAQVDVFTTEPVAGNPVAVVVDGAELSIEVMQRFAAWTNLSETTFLSPPTAEAAAAGADYRLRIFTPTRELPFAGHPTLGSAHAWLEAGGRPRTQGRIVQECAAGLITIAQIPMPGLLPSGATGLAFEAPPLVRSGPVHGDDLAAVVAQLGITPDDVLAAQWIDNGPGWMGIELADADAVLALNPVSCSYDIGVFGFHPDGARTRYEVRAFFPQGALAVEDPVTGSLNASIAQWLIGAGRVRPPYIAAQGTALGRRGRVFIDAGINTGVSTGIGTGAAEAPVGPDSVWVGGGTVTCVSGTLTLP